MRLLFAQAGINIEEISSGPRFHANSDDQNTDLEEIISHEGAPQSDDGAALYTYVANQEALSGLSPGRGPAGNNQGQSSDSAQNAASSGRLTIHHRGQEARFPIHQRQDAQRQAPVQIYPMHQHFSNTQPPMQQFEQQSFTGAANLQRQGVNAMRSSNFVPLGTVPGDYPAQSGSALYSAVSSPTLGNLQSTDAFVNVPGMIGNEMDVDRMKFWLDQSYELFDMKADDPNVTGPEYQTQNLFFDPTC